MAWFLFFLLLVGSVGVACYAGWKEEKLHHTEADKRYWEKVAKGYLDQKQAIAQNQEELERKKTALNYIMQLSGEMLKDMAPLPDINDTEAFFGGMSADMRGKVSIALGTEFQQGVAQLVGLELEAVNKLREIRLRFALFQHKLHYATQLAPANLKAVLESLYRAQEVAKEYDKKLDDPAFAQAANYFKAREIGHLAVQIEQREPEGLPVHLDALTLFLPEASQAEDGEVEVFNKLSHWLGNTNGRGRISGGG